MSRDDTFVMDLTLYVIKWLILSMGMFDIGAAFVVAVQYGVRWRRQKTDSLLPLHVWVVATSYCILLILTTTGRLQNLGDPLWRWTFYGIAVVLGFIAMVAIERVGRQRGFIHHS